MILNTERLMLRPLDLDDDLDALFAIFNHPEVMRFMPALPHSDPETTHANLSRSMSRAGAIHWAICLRGDKQPIGVVNYLGETSLPGLGYILHPDYWGRGITTEACRAALDYGFTERGLDRVELWIDERNHASRRVAQKLGFAQRGKLRQKYANEEDYHIMLVYGMWAEEWQREPLPDRPRVFRSEPVLAVSDVSRSAAFYRDALGFRVDFLYGEPPTHAGVTLGDWSGSGVTLQLTKSSSPITPAGYTYIFVDSRIAALLARFEANDVTVISPLQSHPWGMREFTIADPDGHQLRFGTHA